MHTCRHLLARRVLALAAVLQLLLGSSASAQPVIKKVDVDLFVMSKCP